MIEISSDSDEYIAAIVTSDCWNDVPRDVMLNIEDIFEPSYRHLRN